MRFISMSLAVLALTACNGQDTDDDTETDVDAIFDADGDGVESDIDCDDRSSSTFPGAQEVCDSIDNDCDGLIDEDAIDGDTWYVDYDGDGYGNPNFVESFCTAPRAGYTRNADDCDDLEIRTYPGNTEVCDNVDNDCNGEVDDNPRDIQTFYQDLDGDGFGTEAANVISCTAPEGYVTIRGDCDDANPGLNPDTRWFPDMDRDGFGQPFFSIASCQPPPDHVSSDTDCLDSDPNAYPGAAIRDDISLCTIDLDDDGYGDMDPPLGVDPGTDCDDASIETFPGSIEYCDEIDNDCNGTVDDDYARGTTVFYEDADGDGFGNTTTRNACVLPEGYSDNADDCNDTSDAAAPGLLELCDDSLDNDCEGTTDLNCAYIIEDDAGSMIEGDDGTFGHAMSVGDISGDDVADIAITAETFSDTASSAGQVYLYFGPLELDSDLDDRDANVTISSSVSFDYLGNTIDISGDFNDDGSPDLVVSAYGDDTPSSLAGAVWVYYGPLDDGAALTEDDLDLKITGSTGSDYAGRYLTRVMNVDADEADELVMGVHLDDEVFSNAGLIAIFNGTTETSLALEDADIWILGSESSGNVGYSFQEAGDFTGDGEMDFMYGEPGAEKAYILPGPLVAGTYTNEDASLTFDDTVNANDDGGSGLAYGDLNDDGYLDYLFASGEDDVGGSASGSIYLFEGSMEGFGETVSTAAAEARISEVGSFNYLGGPNNTLLVADVDGDETDDLITTSYSHDGYVLNGGAALVFYGPFSGELTVSDYDVAVFSETSGAQLGRELLLEDVDDDDSLDLVLSAPEADEGNGFMYVLYGF